MLNRIKKALLNRHYQKEIQAEQRVDALCREKARLLVQMYGDNHLIPYNVIWELMIYCEYLDKRDGEW